MFWRKKEKKDKDKEDLEVDFEYPLRISDLSEALEISDWSIRDFLKKKGIYKKLDRDRRGVKIKRELADRILGNVSNPPEQIDEVEYDYPVSWLAKKMDVCSRTVKRWLRRKGIVSYCRRDRRGIRIPRSICAMICPDIDIGEPSKQIPSRIREVNQGKYSKKKDKTNFTEISEAQKEILRKRKEKIEMAIGEEPVPSYRFFVRRNRGEPTGILGAFYGEDLNIHGSIEECLLQNYGGGNYSVKVYENGVPHPEVFHYQIAGQPKIPKNMLDSYRQKKIDSLQKEIESLEQEVNEQKSQVEEHPILKAIQVLAESFSDALDESLNREDFSAEEPEVAEASVNQEVSSETKNLLKDFISESQSEKDQIFEALSAINDSIEKIQSQVKSDNLQQKKEFHQLSQSIELITREMKQDKRELKELKQMIEALKENQNLGLLLDFGILYSCSPEIKEFVNENANKIINQLRQIFSPTQGIVSR